MGAEKEAALRPRGEPLPLNLDPLLAVSAKALLRTAFAARTHAALPHRPHAGLAVLSLVRCGLVAFDQAVAPVVLLPEHLAALALLRGIHLLVVVALKLIASELVAILLLARLAAGLLVLLLLTGLLALLTAGFLIHVTATEILVSHCILSIFPAPLVLLNARSAACDPGEWRDYCPHIAGHSRRDGQALT